jgi:hypothetical protein
MDQVSSTSGRGHVWARWTVRGVLMLLPLVTTCVLAAGCNPASIAMMLMPFYDDKEPAKCKLSSPTRETTVAIVSWFGNRELQLYSELAPTERELADQLATSLHDRFKLNKEKVKIIPTAQVRAYQKAITDTWGPVQIGKKLKADYVISLEIESLSLHAKKSFETLYQGETAINVKVYDLAKPEGEQVIFGPEVYSRVYPKDNPVPAETGGINQFRGRFERHVSKELSRWFAAWSSDERMHNMDNDF